MVENEMESPETGGFPERVGQGTVAFALMDKETLMEIAVAVITAIAYKTNRNPGEVATYFATALISCDDQWEANGRDSLERTMERVISGMDDNIEI